MLDHLAAARAGALSPRQEQDGRWLRERFAGRCWIGVELLTGGFDARRLELWRRSARRWDLPRVAAGDVHMHRRSRRALQDVLTAIRLNTPLQDRGLCLFPERRALFTAVAAAARVVSRAAARADARRSPSAARSISMNCATNTPRKSCRPAPLPPAICAH